MIINNKGFRPAVLIVKIGAIGDGVMALPLIRRAINRGTVTLVVGENLHTLYANILANVEFVVVDEKKLLAGPRYSSLLEIIKVWIKLSAKKFDEGYLLHRDWRYRLLTFPLRCRLFSVQPDLDSVDGRLRGRHMADEFLELDRSYKLIGAKAAMPKIAKRCGHFDKSAKFSLCLAPGGASNILRTDDLRRWPVENYRAVAQWARKKGWRVILVGGKSDLWVNTSFRDLDVDNFLGATDLPELVELFNSVDLVLCHDSGPMHLAALGCPRVLALFGPTSELQFGWRIPGFYSMTAEYRLGCSPCYNGRNYAICDSNKCMKSIDVEMVIQKIEAIYLEIKSNE